MESNTTARDPWSSLREKMDALDHMPGYPTPDTATLWQKMQEGERKETRRRRFYQYGIAAAVALVGSLLLTLTVNKQQPAVQAKKVERPGLDKKQPSPAVSSPIADAVQVAASRPETELVQARKKKKQPVRHPEPAPKPPYKLRNELLAQETLPEVQQPPATSVATMMPTAETPLPYMHIRAKKAYQAGNPGSGPNEMRRMVIRKSIANEATAASPSPLGHTVKEIQPLN